MPYPTPETLPATTQCRQLFIPDDVMLVAAVAGALTELEKPENWEQVDGQTVEDTVAAIKQMLANYSGVPCVSRIGEIVPYVTENVPSHLLPCDGDIYQNSAYPDLAAVIHSNLIVDAFSFRVPQMTARIPAGEGLAQDGQTTYEVGDNLGEQWHTLTTNEIPSHTHTHALWGGAAGSFWAAGSNYNVEHIATPNTGATGGGQKHNNVPPITVVRFGIVWRD